MLHKHMYFWAYLGSWIPMEICAVPTKSEIKSLACLTTLGYYKNTGQKASWHLSAADAIMTTLSSLFFRHFHISLVLSYPNNLCCRILPPPPVSTLSCHYRTIRLSEFPLPFATNCLLMPHIALPYCLVSLWCCVLKTRGVTAACFFV